MAKKARMKLAEDLHHQAEEDELSIINVVSIKLLQEVTQVEDLSQAVALNLHGRNLVKLQALELCPNLRTVDLSFNMLKRIDGLQSLSKLKELKLYDNQISTLSGITSLSALHSLDISGNRLTSLQGLAGLRGLRVLRCAYNPHLDTLDGLGKANTIEVLDASHCNLPDLASLSTAVSLTTLSVNGNKLHNLKGLSRCDKLQELHAAHNQLTTLQGLRACAATLKELDVRDNKLTSTDGLTEGLVSLHEMFVSDNQITSITGLHLKAPALETLDLSRNKLGCTTEAAGQQLMQHLSALPDLTWVGLEGNPGYSPGLQAVVLASVTQLEGLDELVRPARDVQPDVWVNPADAGPDQELTELLTGDVKPSALLPTVEEIEAFKQAMNITSQLPVIGLANTQPHSRPTSAACRQSVSRGGTERPGTARPGTASTRLRPGTACLLASQGSVKDVMMHQQLPSSRTGGNGRLMTPEQYTQAVDAFGCTMSQYSTSLQSVLATMKAGLQLDISSAAEQLRTPEGIAARQLPVMPILPSMPPDMLPKTSTATPPSASKQQKPEQKAAEMAAKYSALADPDLPAVLDLYDKLYPKPVTPKHKGAAPGKATSQQLSRGTVARVGPDRDDDESDQSDDRDELIVCDSDDEGLGFADSPRESSLGAVPIGSESGRSSISPGLTSAGQGQTQVLPAERPHVSHAVTQGASSSRLTWSAHNKARPGSSGGLRPGSPAGSVSPRMHVGGGAAGVGRAAGATVEVVRAGPSKTSTGMRRTGMKARLMSQQNSRTGTGS